MVDKYRDTQDRIEHQRQKLYEEAKEKRKVSSALGVWLAAIAILVVSSLLSGCSGHIGGVSVSEKIEQYGPGLKLYRVLHDNGGEARAQYQKWQDIGNSGIDGFVIDGPCVSSCAYFVLTSPVVCYTEHASFGLHYATMYGLARTEETRKFDELILSHWPEGMARLMRDKAPSGGSAALGYDTSQADLAEYWPEGRCRPGFFKKEG